MKKQYVGILQKKKYNMFKGTADNAIETPLLCHDLIRLDVYRVRAAYLSVIGDIQNEQHS